MIIDYAAMDVLLCTIFKAASREKQAGVSKFLNVRKRGVQRKVKVRKNEVKKNLVV